MSMDIIFPDGQELSDLLVRGEAICNECGALMERTEDPKGGCDIFVCPNCGWQEDEMDYEYAPDGERPEWAPGSGMEFDDIPPGCLACGGPYPDCKSACKLFDD